MIWVSEGRSSPATAAAPVSLVTRNRASAVRSFLVGEGVSPGRLNALTYGKERPVALGSDAQAWAQNRRAATVTIN